MYQESREEEEFPTLKLKLKKNKQNKTNYFTEYISLEIKGRWMRWLGR